MVRLGEVPVPNRLMWVTGALYLAAAGLTFFDAMRTVALLAFVLAVAANVAVVALYLARRARHLRGE